MAITPDIIRNSDFLTYDLGNAKCKTQVSGDDATRHIMDNAVLRLSPDQWDNLKSRAKNRPAEFAGSQVFAIKERKANSTEYKKTGDWYPYVVGDAAPQFGRVMRQTGEIKYTYDYMGALAVGNIMNEFPHGHDSLILALGHPTSAIGQQQNLLRSVGGKHLIQDIYGNEFEYYVRGIMPYDEPVGGAVCWMEKRGVYNQFELQSGDVALVVDIGGGVSSMTRMVIGRNAAGQFRIDPIYDPEMSPTVDMGINDVKERLRSLLKQESPLFETAKASQIPDRMLNDIIRYGETRVSGELIDFSDFVPRSDYILLDKMESLYNERMDGGRPFAVIIITGGGGAALYAELVNRLNHANIDIALGDNDGRDMQYANLAGADIIFRNWRLSQIADDIRKVVG